MSTSDTTEGLLRELAPQALGVVARRHRFPEAEDAVQEALVAAARQWPATGVPDNPLGWLVRDAGARFAEPSPDELAARLSSVLRVLYLLFSEGYATSPGPDLGRPDLSAEAIRLTRMARGSIDDPEVAGLLALMLLTEARGPARTGVDGQVVPLADQDRSRWDRRMIAEGFSVLAPRLTSGPLGPYRLQAAIAGVHAEAATPEATDWARIATLYQWLEELTGSPLVRLNRAIAVGEAESPDAGLALLEGLDADLGEHHRLHAARAHLLEAARRPEEALAELRAAATGSTNTRERDHLTLRAARLRASLDPEVG